MPNPFNITILDTSPIFQYYPSRDGPISTSWNSTFSGSPDSTWHAETLGIGTSAHRTTLLGASVRLDWLGTAIYLYGDASPGSYAIDLDGTQTNTKTEIIGLLFSQSGLTYGPHSVTLRVVQGSFVTSISSAITTVGMGEKGTIIQNHTIATGTVPLTSDGIVLSGTWKAHPRSNQSDSQIVTNTTGSAISFPITSASAFYIVGQVNYNHGPYRVTLTPPSDLGPARTVDYNGLSRWISPNTIMYLATGLDRTRTYQVVLTNEANLYYDQNHIVIFDTPLSSPSDGSSSSQGSLPVAAIAGGVVGGIVLILIISIFLFLRWRKRRTPDVDGLVDQRDSLYDSEPDHRISMASPGPLPPWNAQDSVPTAENPTTELLYSNVPATDIMTMVDARAEHGVPKASSGVVRVGPATAPPRDYISVL